MKKNIDLARAWRDEDYFLSLTEEERASLGAHPAGSVTTDAALRSITGGCGYTVGGCTVYCQDTYGGFITPSCTPCPPAQCY